MENEYQKHVTRVRKTVFSDKDLAKHADDVRKVVKDPLERIQCSIRLQRTFVLLVCIVALAGCTPSNLVDPMPNTGRGFWQDLSGTAAAMAEYHDNHIYNNSAKDMPRILNQTEERVSWVERMKARYDRVKK